MPKIYKITCERCSVDFDHTNHRKKYCNTCRETVRREINRKNMRSKRKPKKALNLPLNKAIAILEAYNRKHNTNYTYGQFINLISQDLIKLEE